MIALLWTKVWTVDIGNLVDMPRVRAGFVSDIPSNSEYVITHEDGTEKVYTHGEVFLSCRSAHRYQVSVLGQRLQYLKPLVRRMESTLIHMAG